MKHLFYESTQHSPRVEVIDNQELVLRGRSIMEDPIAFYKPVIQWITDYSQKTVTIEMHIEYMNTSSSKLVLNLLLAVKNNTTINTAYIKWYYEEDDEDMLDMGKDFESIVCLPFDFYEYSENES